jgi:Holliday junction resolvase-like predicted endonuclease
LYLLSRYGDRWPACRFDVVLVESGRIEWLQSAFTIQEE